jgi:hypothetical protein
MQAKLAVQPNKCILYCLGQALAAQAWLASQAKAKTWTKHTLYVDRVQCIEILSHTSVN